MKNTIEEIFDSLDDIDLSAPRTPATVVRVFNDRVTFPVRVWEKGSNGLWSSRATTPVDTARRRQWLRDFA